MTKKLSITDFNEGLGTTDLDDAKQAARIKCALVSAAAEHSGI